MFQGVSLISHDFPPFVQKRFATTGSEFEVAFDADEQGEVKKVPAGATLYYDLELLRIIKP